MEKDHSGLAMRNRANPDGIIWQTISQANRRVTGCWKSRIIGSEGVTVLFRLPVVSIDHICFHFDFVRIDFIFTSTYPCKSGHEGDFELEFSESEMFDSFFHSKTYGNQMEHQT